MNIKKIYSFFLDRDFKKKQAFHSKSTPRIGGIFLFLSLFFFFLFSEQSFFLIKVFIISTFFFFIGLLGDLLKNFKPHYKFFAMILGGLFFIIFFDIRIANYQFPLLDLLNKKSIYLSYLIILFAIIFIINGANFVDGFNGLLIIHTIILLLILTFLNYHNLNSNFMLNLCIYLIFIYLILLFFNFPSAKIFLGDSGAYLSGSLISIISIETSYINPSVSKFFFACILFYLFFEVFFSFFRKLINKKNPFLPDRLHMHMLLFNLLVKKKIKKKTANYLSSIIINFIFILLITPVFFIEKVFYVKIYFFILLLFYFFFYNFLFFKVFKFKNV